MPGFFIALLANLLLALSLVFDKLFLSKKETGHTLTYVFWIGVLNAFGIFLAPFGFILPALATVLVALASGVSFFLALLFYYKALKEGHASQTLAVIGGFAPLATIAIANTFSLTPLNIAEAIAFGFLVVGGFLMFVSERVDFKKIFWWVLLASLFFGLGNTLEKIVFTNTNFVSGFVLTKIGTLLAAATLLVIPSIRKKIFSHSRSTAQKHRVLYIGNRILAGTATFFIFYAISLAHPALVESIAGFRYALIFLIVIVLKHWHSELRTERFTGWPLFSKIIATVLIMLGLVGLSAQNYFAAKPIPPENQVSWGVTFSQLMSERLGLDWRENYLAVLNDLHPTGVRLVAYWELIEPRQDKWNFDDLDWQINEAQKAGIPTILAVGQKVPRWPECHYPDWLDKNNEAARKQELFNYLEAVVQRYKDRNGLLYWQVENEPFLNFGECPPLDSNLIDQEVALVRSLDTSHNILMTDGGEIGDWYRAAERGDAFGTTLYRIVYNNIFGHITYPLTPEFYPLREALLRALTRKPEQKIIAIEVGAEPWTKKQIYEISPEEQISLFSKADFKETIAYAREARFDTYYLWGVEWWYAMKTKNGISDYWDMARQTIQSGSVR